MSEGTLVHARPIIRVRLPDPHPIRATAAPPAMPADEQARLRAAALQATRRHPGPIGELLERELRTWEELGFRLDGDGLIGRVVAELLRPADA